MYVINSNSQNMVLIIKKAVKSSRETLYTPNIPKPLDRAFLILQGRPDIVSSRHYISLSGWFTTC